MDGKSMKVFASCTFWVLQTQIIIKSRWHFQLHPKPALIPHRLSCTTRTIHIDHLLLVGGLQVPSKTSALIQQNRERLDSSEREHWSPAASKGHSCPDGSGRSIPLPRSHHSSSILLPSFPLLAGPCISIVSFWPCAALSQRISLDLARGTTQNRGSGEPCIVLHRCSKHTSTSTTGLLLHKSNTCITSEKPHSVFPHLSAVCSGQSCLSAHSISSIAHVKLWQMSPTAARDSQPVPAASAQDGEAQPKDSRHSLLL